MDFAGWPHSASAAELLSSTVMKDYIARWRKEFDHIIIDTPPCLSVTDAVVLSPDADRVILVARSGQTTKLALRHACDLLLQVNAKVMGIVLNALNLRSADGYYSYGGPYARHYYDEDSPTDGITTATELPAKFLSMAQCNSHAARVAAQNTPSRSLDQMQIELRSPLRNFSFAVVCLRFAWAYICSWTLQAYLASRLATVPDVAESPKGNPAGTIER